MFKGILIEKDDSGYRATFSELNDEQLPVGDVTVNVQYSSLNYKDALAITGKSPVVRNFPMVPGVDLVGYVERSESPRFNIGDSVLLNGFGVGEVHWGGFAEKAQVSSDWLIPKPDGLSAFQTMAIGTAGYTAMLCVIALEKQGLTPEKGPILVTGANGGVGSYAIAILAKLGFQVIASTGRNTEADYLKKLGAHEVIDRASLSEPARPLGKELWAGAIDSVGSHTLVNVCAGLKYGGTVAACGLAQGYDFPATVMPFILRGIHLAGIDSVMRPLEDRIEAWQRLAELVSDEVIDLVSSECELEDAINSANKLLAGEVRGRVVVKVHGDV